MSYKLSKSFSPPRCDLRRARLIDDCGRPKHAQVPVAHRDPYDVSESQLDYYCDVWGFVDPPDLLFYAFAICRFTSQHSEPPIYFERWIETVDGRLPVLVECCSAKQLAELKALLSEHLQVVVEFELEAIFEFLASTD